MLILCVLHPEGINVVEAGLTISVQLRRSVPGPPLSSGAGSGPPDTVPGGARHRARAVAFPGEDCRMGWEPCTGTAFGLLWEGAIQSDPFFLFLSSKRFHGAFMLLTSFSSAAGTSGLWGLRICVTGTEGRVWQMWCLLQVPAGKPCQQGLPDSLVSPEHKK